MNMNLVMAIVNLALKYGLPTVMKLMEDKLGKPVGEMTSEEMADALAAIEIADTDAAIEAGAIGDDDIPF